LMRVTLYVAMTGGWAEKRLVAELMELASL
jgi:hypothetical protein